MALEAQHAIFRAYVLLMAEPGPAADALDQLAEAAREGEAVRLAHERTPRKPRPDFK